MANSVGAREDTVNADHCRTLALSSRFHEVNNLLGWALAPAGVNIDRGRIEAAAPFAADYNKFNRPSLCRLKYLRTLPPNLCRWMELEKAVEGKLPAGAVDSRPNGAGIDRYIAL